VYSKILILRFPDTEVHKPIVCYLAKDFDLTFNILNAAILPRKEGIMVLELSGTKKKFRAGIKYLESQNIHVQTAAQEIKRNKKKCTHCGAYFAPLKKLAAVARKGTHSGEKYRDSCPLCRRTPAGWSRSFST